MYCATVGGTRDGFADLETPMTRAVPLLSAGVSAAGVLAAGILAGGVPAGVAPKDGTAP